MVENLRPGVQHGQDVARLVDRVAAHPGARGVRPLPGGGHFRASGLTYDGTLAEAIEAVREARASST